MSLFFEMHNISKTFLGIKALDGVDLELDRGEDPAETYRFLRLDRPTEEDMAEGAAFPPGSVHLPQWVENEWLKQFVAEQLVTVRTKRGFARLE